MQEKLSVLSIHENLHSKKLHIWQIPSLFDDYKEDNDSESECESDDESGESTYKNGRRLEWMIKKEKDMLDIRNYSDSFGSVTPSERR